MTADVSLADDCASCMLAIITKFPCLGGLENVLNKQSGQPDACMLDLKIRNLRWTLTFWINFDNLALLCYNMQKHPSSLAVLADLFKKWWKLINPSKGV